MSKSTSSIKPSGTKEYSDPNISLCQLRLLDLLLLEKWATEMLSGFHFLKMALCLMLAVEMGEILFLFGEIQYEGFRY